jgi:CUG-BP- and ETR3-like factor
MYPGGPMAGGMRPMPSPYGHLHHYYPASSPGPPIQTTASNKGPDGANLFIFHIPNHFTNVDMYNLFCPYGNLLSVRIMVEKDTGRSRGFGFVSYDNPESAALAIKELNGYAIGNKRLKVQHKQIRQRDLADRDGGSYGDHSSGGTFSSSLPPSGPGGESIWYGPRESRQGGESAPSTAVANAVANTAGVKQPAEEEGSTRESTEAGQSADTSSPLGNLGALQSALPEVARTTKKE